MTRYQQRQAETLYPMTKSPSGQKIFLLLIYSFKRVNRSGSLTSIDNEKDLMSSFSDSTKVAQTSVDTVKN